MNCSSRYVFEPLTHIAGAIRLVKILPGNRCDDIRCKLRLDHLSEQDEPPKYSALSYVWGDKENTRQIILDGHPFEVTRNLHAALLYLRDTMQTRFFWIDAICINQTDEEERSEQVKMMKRIYGMAEVTVVWLAEREGLEGGSARMKAALEVLVEEVGQTGYFENMATDSDVACKIRMRFLERFDELVAADHTLLLSLEFVFANEYWSRVWTAQEFVSARKVLIQYGQSTVDYQVLDRVITLINKTAEDSVHPQRSPIMFREAKKAVESSVHISKDTLTLNLCDFIPSILKLCRLQNRNLGLRVDLRNEILRCHREGSEKRIDLYTLLVKNSEALSGDPKDKIYSLVGLATDCRVEVDYRESLQEICKRVTKYLIDEVGSLEPLRLGRGEVSNAEGFPTWCPDWTLTHSDWVRRCFGRKTSYKLDFKQRDYFTSPDSNVLTAYGTNIGQIQRHAIVDGGEVGSEKSDDDLLNECIKQFMCTYNPEDEDYPGGNTYKDALLDILYLGNEPRECLEGITTVTTQHEARNGPITLFKTDKGHVGRAFDEVREGDRVCVLRGSNAPCILRKQVKDWTYVSQAYGKLTLSTPLTANL